MKQFVSTGRPAGGLAAVSFFDGLVFFAPVSLLVRTTAGVTVSQGKEQSGGHAAVRVTWSLPGLGDGGVTEVAL